MKMFDIFHWLFWVWFDLCRIFCSMHALFVGLVLWFSVTSSLVWSLSNLLEHYCWLLHLAVLSYLSVTDRTNLEVLCIMAGSPYAGSCTATKGRLHWRSQGIGKSMGFYFIKVFFQKILICKQILLAFAKICIPVEAYASLNPFMNEQCKLLTMLTNGSPSALRFSSK